MGDTYITVTPDLIRGPAVFGGVLEEAGCRIKSGMTR